MFNIKKEIKFISFEGIDGSGKTTQSKMLADYLNKNNVKTLWTREPGGTQVGERIREILANNELDNISDLFLIMAGRNEHIKNLIKPSIETGHVVICDRFVDSSATYQETESLTMDMIYDLHAKYLENFMPSITFYIDVSYENAHSRIACRKGNDRYDNLGEKFFIKSQKNYEKILEKFPQRFIKINGDKELEEIHRDIIKYLI
jgi:dTMP kinase